MALGTNTLGMEYEVFLSFRGPDTRYGFACFLHQDMIEKGIRTFIDDEELRPGQQISGNLLQALDKSQIYIPIFSKNFASSVWCLREVAHMVDCTSKSDGKKEILPIFLDVEPDDVKLRSDLYRNDLSRHEERHGLDVVKRWRDALREVAARVGWKLEGNGFRKLIKSVVREVQLKLKGKDRCLPIHLVEMDDEEEIEKLMDIDSDHNVRFIIIHGTGGIGKSTLASIIFNRFRSKFIYSSFLEDVQEWSQRDGLLKVQMKLLSDTLGLSSVEGISDPNDGINRIRRGLGKKKVLVVLDNVDEKKQLEKLAGNCNWFGPGSRIIVTVRDISKILNEDRQMQPSNYWAHPIKEMPLDRAIQLFSKHAFRSDTHPEDWYKLSEEIILSIGRLPLTLEVVGSLFGRKGRLKWEETLKDLKQVPHRDIRKTLMISYEKLDTREKEIFLDIACFCIGEDKTKAYHMWDACAYSPTNTIDDLLSMSLIKIDENNKFWMHNEVRDLGRYIVYEQNVEDAGQRSRVRIDDKTLDILRSYEGKGSVKALSLKISHDLTPEELAWFPKLRFLGGERLNFIGDFERLLRSLRWLSWHHCPPNLSATNLHLVNLVVLDLSESNITKNWGGWRQIERAKSLKVLDLTNCRSLTRTPNFSKFDKLEKLVLAGCVKLSTIDSSIGKLTLLRTLDIDQCFSLQGLPKEIGSLECLSEIIMSSGFEEFKLPETLGNLKSLTRFEVRSHDGISQLPHSIGRLTNLMHLVLFGCINLAELPDSIGELKSLRLKIIRVGYTNIHTLPCALGGLEMLEELDASFCYCLMDEIPWEMWGLPRLRILDLDGTPISTVPRKICGFSSLKCLVVKAAQYPVLPNLSSLVHLEVLQVCRIHTTITFCTADEVISPWKDGQSISQLPHSLSTLILRWIPQLPDFSNLKSLSVLHVSECPMRHFPILKYSERLRELDISSCKFLESIPDLSCMKRLQALRLSELPKLVETPGLGELELLKLLFITQCNMIKQLPNLSKLKNLWYLKLDGCEKMRVIEGLKELNSLKNVDIKRCMSLKRLPYMSAFTKLETDWTSSEAAPFSLPCKGSNCNNPHWRTNKPEAECIISESVGTSK
ncbi:hypothetical protein BT93_H2623 [Corymbia citriodora subsp. variegata]|nr:hypothetical protein BT93_H2623 [Corymbia citriodora subsp. variegata]KAF8017503.1 hypothetical protein BT93_H2623 [Corymbia citriodora subsp. variegata]